MDHKEIRRRIWNSDDPLAKGKEILLDEYRKTDGADEYRIAPRARFEILRSIVVQTVYEATGDKRLCVEVSRIEPERADAQRHMRHYLKGGFEHFLASNFSGCLRQDIDSLRVDLDSKANTMERFVGSDRNYVEGAGYGLSVRKADSMNQDSFHISRYGKRVVLSVADGCGGAFFSSIASYLLVREISKLSGAEIAKGDLVEMNRLIAIILNDQRMMGALGGNLLGGSTVLLGISRGRGRKVLKVGDSLCYIEREDIRLLTPQKEMRNVMGQVSSLSESEIEQYDEEGGRLILTSDGLSGYIGDAPAVLTELLRLNRDPIMIAERALRIALGMQIAHDCADDITIAIQDFM